ncbi:unnamed protein product [Boreogadus saida]
MLSIEETSEESSSNLTADPRDEMPRRAAGSRDLKRWVSVDWGAPAGTTIRREASPWRARLRHSVTDTHTVMFQQLIFLFWRTELSCQACGRRADVRGGDRRDSVTELQRRQLLPAPRRGPPRLMPGPCFPTPLQGVLAEGRGGLAGSLEGISRSAFWVSFTPWEGRGPGRCRAGPAHGALTRRLFAFNMKHLTHCWSPPLDAAVSVKGPVTAPGQRGPFAVPGTTWVYVSGPGHMAWSHGLVTVPGHSAFVISLFPMAAGGYRLI